MEKIAKFNTRILIGQELGEIYLIIQEYVNNKWQNHPKNYYRGNYLVKKKLKELLKYNINGIRKSKKNDLIKFKIENSIYVYVSDYSIIKQNPELKSLKTAINKNLVYQKIANGFVLKKDKHKSNNAIKFVIASSISLGIIASINYTDNNKVIFKFDDIKLNKNNHNNSQTESFLLTNFNSDFGKIKIDYQDYEKVEHKLNNEFDIIEEYSNMYFMDYDRVKQIYLSNYDEINNSNNIELSLLLKVKDEFYSDASIDKTPIVTGKTSEEKEKYIIDIAEGIYKVEDKDELATLLAIHRLETSWGMSDRCVYQNNPGGLKEDGEFLEFKTFEIGAESFVRNVLKIKTIAENNYQFDCDILYGMQQIYCDDDIRWAIEAEQIKNSILDNEELDKYLNKEKNQYILKKYTNQ